MALDERLERELDRAARPADPAGVYEDLIRRRERLRIRRRVTAGAIAFAVFVAGAVGVYALSRTIGNEPRPAGAELSGRIVFSTITEADGSVSPTGWHLVSMNPDGSDRIDITPRGLTETEHPTVSPDGSRIAFTGFEGQDHALYVADADGANARPIHPLGELDTIRDLAWSPDGGTIAMALELGFPATPAPATGAPDVEYPSAIWMIAPDGSDMRQITTVGRETSVSWSPDSTRLAFSRHAPIYVETETVANDLYVIDADGDHESRLTHDGNASDPAWSPDGTTIAFDRTSPSGDGLDLYLIDADGSNLRPLTTAEGNEYGAAWSPTGDALAFSELQPDAAREHSLAQVSVIRPDGSDHRVLTSSEMSPAAIGLWWSVSPSPVEPPAPTAVTGPTSPTGPTSTGDDATTDLGLGYPVCDVMTTRGHFTEGTDGTAYVATIADQGRCPPLGGRGAEQVLAVDVTGDGVADTSYEPLVCDQWCSAFAAPDVDGDGTEEILIQNVQFSIAGLRLFELQAGDGGVSIAPVVVTPPGSPGSGPEGFEGGAEPQFWLGGDAGNADAIRCEPYEGGRAFVSVTSNHPVEGGDHVDVTETWFVLEGFEVRVVDVREFDAPIEDAERPYLETGGCGADLDPYD